MLLRRPYRQAGEGQQIRGTVTDLVDDEAPGPAYPTGAGDRAIEVGARQPQHHEYRCEWPAAECDSDARGTGSDHAGNGERVGGHLASYSGVDDEHQAPGEPWLERVKASRASCRGDVGWGAVWVVTCVFTARSFRVVPFSYE